MRFICSFFTLFGLCFGLDFKVGSYNIENLFDLQHNKTEYNEFIPNTKSGWNKQIYQIKLSNSSKVIRDLNADILGLVEIESKLALEDLMRASKLYKYGYFLKNPNSAIGVAIVSKFPIQKTFGIKIDSKDKRSRPILEAHITISNKPLIVFVSHWKSKKSSESHRIEYAKALKKRIDELSSDQDYIILGDLNSNYNEFETFRNNKKLNDTEGYTGINHILNTVSDNDLVTKNKLLKSQNLLFNLWLELPKEARFSETYKGGANTPDNIIIPKALFDGKNISYKMDSFGVLKKDYFFKNGKIIRWKMKDKKHIGEGYSDHLPVYAYFATDKLYAQNFEIPDIKITKISDIYTQDELNKDAVLSDCVVLLKHEKTAIIKQVINRAILVYGENSLLAGNVYDIKIKDISTFYGMSEIKELEILNEKGKFTSPERLYLDANKINIFDTKYTNEIIYNLLAFYNKGYLEFADKKIKLYAKNKQILPKENSIIRLKFGHLAIRNTKPQIIIYKKENYTYAS